MPRSVCTLNADERNKLEQYILSKDADKFGQTLEERTEILNNYLENTKAYWAPDVQIGLSLPKLPSFLALFNMSIKDAYDIWGVPLHWPNETAAQAADIIDNLSLQPDAKPYVDYMHNMVKSFLVDEWDPDSRGYIDNASRRMIFLFKQFDTKPGQMELLSNIPENFSSNLDERGLRGSVNPLDLAWLCESIEAPFHWCAGFDPDVLCLGKTSTTELFMDDFLRISKGYRKCIKDVMQSIYENVYCMDGKE